MMISSPVSGFFGGTFADFGAAKKKAKKPAATKATLSTSSAKAAKAAAKTAAKRLQTALVIIGRTVGDGTLANVKIDGAPGQKTADATNRALTKHIGAGQALPQYRTGRLPLTYVKDNANTLATIIETEIKRRGGTVVSPAVAIAGTAKYKADAKKAAAAAKKAAAAKIAAGKLAAKQAAATASARAKVQTAAQAKATAAAARLRAKQAKNQAAATKDPKLKATYAAQAAAAESQAEQADQTAAALAVEAGQDAVVAQTAATQQVAQNAAADASAVDAQRQAVASTGMRAPVAPLPPSAEESAAMTVAREAATALMPASTTPTGPEDITPTASSGSGGESALTKFKWPLIAAGVAGLAGVAFLVLKKPSHKAGPTRTRTR
jgi:hypothetical protein